MPQIYKDRILKFLKRQEYQPLKLAQLVHDYVHADVYEIYRDMRCFGKGYEEFYNRTDKMGVHFYHGKVNRIEASHGKLVVHRCANHVHVPQPAL